MSGSPEVVVLGMPSSGKTVFLSVLGRTFTLAAEDERAETLGFRMAACDDTTRRMVAANYAALENGSWPKSTVEGQVTPLAWDVFTGRRRLMTLSSMDVSGETFRKAFASRGESAAVDTAEEEDDSDALLGAGSGSRRKSLEQGAERLRQAVDAAKVVCLFVNIALPPKGEQLENFRLASTSMCSLLSKDASIASKTLVVLTQAHLHQAEIEREGGPVSYLGRIAGDLRQIISDRGIPVITVSAVNEESAENLVPERIESDGLFGFLLTVAGMVAPHALKSVKDAYLAFLSARFAYRQRPCRSIAERISLIRRFSEAGMLLASACEGYLSDANNLQGGPGVPRVPQDVIDFYIKCTRRDPVLVCARTEWKSRFEIDRIWDDELRRQVLAEHADGVLIRGRRVFKNVLARVNEGHDDGAVSETAVYGFEAERLVASREAADLAEWNDRNLDEYRAELANALLRINRLTDRYREELGAVDDGASESSLVSVAACRTELESALSAFRDRWSLDGAPDCAEAQKLEQMFADLCVEEQALRDRIAAALQEQAERARLQARRKRRRKFCLLFVVLCVVVGLAVLLVDELHRREAKRLRLNQLCRMHHAYLAGDYAEVEDLADKIDFDMSLFRTNFAAFLKQDQARKRSLLAQARARDSYYTFLTRLETVTNTEPNHVLLQRTRNLIGAFSELDARPVPQFVLPDFNTLRNRSVDFTSAVEAFDRQTEACDMWTGTRFDQMLQAEREAVEAERAERKRLEEEARKKLKKSLVEKVTELKNEKERLDKDIRELNEKPFSEDVVKGFYDWDDSVRELEGKVKTLEEEFKKLGVEGDQLPKDLSNLSTSVTNLRKSFPRIVCFICERQDDIFGAEQFDFSSIRITRNSGTDSGCVAKNPETQRRCAYVKVSKENRSEKPTTVKLMVDSGTSPVSASYTPFAIEPGITVKKVEPR